MESSPQRIELTRQDLYDRVWSEPDYRVGPQLGLSNVGLAKTCKRLGIPRPPRGYWNQLAAGMKVKRLPLPPAKEGQPESATFIMRDSADSAATTKSTSPKPAPLSLPSDLTVLYSIAQAVLKALRAATVGEDGRVSIHSKGIPHVICTPALAERTAAAIHVLVTEVAQRGVVIETPAQRNSDTHRASLSLIASLSASAAWSSRHGNSSRRLR